MRPIPVAAALLWSGIALAHPARPSLLPAGTGTLALGPHGARDDLGQRRSIRGESVLGRESEELRAMRVFEEERFGRERRRELGPEIGPEADASDEQDPFAGLVLPDIPLRRDAHLLRFLAFYKGERRGRSIMSSWLRKQGRYRELIETALARHHLPHALLYVAMIESGYDPHDRSSVGASGVWQFMPEGARIYGLRIDSWVDERDDPEKATEAVMRYLGDLHAHFGSWPLALAGFNAGYGAVLSSVARYNTNDYWELCRHENGLPWETTLYVPKALAAAVVGENREAFGYQDVVPDPPWTFDRVLAPPSTTLANAAQAAGASLDAVAALNPELRRLRTPPEPWLIRLPRGTGARFSSLYRPREQPVPYHVRPGDRLETIAKRNGTTTAAIKRLNAIKDALEVRPGEVLLLPERSHPRAGSDEDEAPQIVALPDRDAAAEGKKRIFYRVAPGDGVSEVARFFGVSDNDLVRWNNLDPDARLLSSLILQVWVQPEFDPAQSALDPAHLKLVTVGSDEFLDLMEAKKGRRRTSYTVRAGDTLKQVGAHFGLSEGDLERINRIGRQSPLTVGQTLTIYVPLEKRERGAEKALDALGVPLPLPPLDDVDGAIVAASTPVRLPPALCPPKVAPEDAPHTTLSPPPAEDPCFDAALEPPLGASFGPPSDPAEAASPTGVLAPPKRRAGRKGVATAGALGLVDKPERVGARP